MTTHPAAYELITMRETANQIAKRIKRGVVNPSSDAKDLEFIVRLMHWAKMKGATIEEIECASALA